MLTFDPELEAGLEDEEDVGQGREEKVEGGRGPVGVPSLKVSLQVGHALLGRERLQNLDHTWRHHIHLNGSGESHDLSDPPTPPWRLRPLGLTSSGVGNPLFWSCNRLFHPYVVTLRGFGKCLIEVYVSSLKTCMCLPSESLCKHGRKQKT